MTEPLSVCARCAAVNPTCCRIDPAAASACFPLSDAEAERFAPHAAALGIQGWVAEENSAAFMRLVRGLFPDRRQEVMAAFPEGGTHKRLALGADGSCQFLRPDGCFLPRHARPWYCQLFPIWIQGGIFDRFLPETCLLTHEAKPLRDVFAAIGLTQETAKELYVALCRDWGMERYDR